eukprot:CAMPEP_0195307756 /NCGR_PEP_ID=MMETSP0707-20130614/37874_1 /TAXON_ID=33640 /ORGANISM="Asterionellopsis glacialis, Strain CCMP134" /LENGTH=648 /DNA_ID=CAMNT_0040372009 /DNA_START=9 /DNA_END=1955 /DNA_ORIENTATION=-
MTRPLLFALSLLLSDQQVQARIDRPAQYRYNPQEQELPKQEAAQERQAGILSRERLYDRFTDQQPWDDVMNKQNIDILIVNERIQPSLLPLHALFTARGLTALNGALPKDTSTPLVNTLTFVSADSAQAGRLYVGYGALPAPPPAQPIPESPTQYYGWIEFTGNEHEIWINLSNVDVMGLPLTLRGTDVDGKPFSLGYKKSVSEIVQELEELAPDAVVEVPGILPNGNPIKKVVGPNKMPEAYPSYDSYLMSLVDAEAQLKMVPDPVNWGDPLETYQGRFYKEGDYVLSLTNEDNGKVFRIRREQLTTRVLYECDGSTVEWGDGPDPPTIPANSGLTTPSSMFRNVCIGFNQGYFTPTGDNNCVNFAFHKPFAQIENGGHGGNAYAKIIHEASNSYGFPYSDANLKVLIRAKPKSLLTLTIHGDDEIGDYDDAMFRTQNMPGLSRYGMAIGGNSQQLGMIRIGNCRYLPTKDGGAYGGFLPEISTWTKMEFWTIPEEENTEASSMGHIWIRTEPPSGLFNNTGSSNFTETGKKRKKKGSGDKNGDDSGVVPLIPHIPTPEYYVSVGESGIPLPGVEKHSDGRVSFTWGAGLAVTGPSPDKPTEDYDNRKFGFSIGAYSAATAGAKQNFKGTSTLFMKLSTLVIFLFSV